MASGNRVWTTPTRISAVAMTANGKGDECLQLEATPRFVTMRGFSMVTQLDCLGRSHASMEVTKETLREFCERVIEMLDQQ
jgi:hypothetical protein